MKTAHPRSVTLVSLAVLVFAGCERSGSITGPVLAAHRFGDLARFSDWSAPVNLGPVVNSASADIEVAITEDGHSLYFASNRPGGFGNQDIWVSQRTHAGDPWGPPQNLGEGIIRSHPEHGS